MPTIWRAWRHEHELSNFQTLRTSLPPLLLPPGPSAHLSCCGFSAVFFPSLASSLRWI